MMGPWASPRHLLDPDAMAVVTAHKAQIMATCPAMHVIDCPKAAAHRGPSDGKKTNYGNQGETTLSHIKVSRVTLRPTAASDQRAERWQQAAAHSGANGYTARGTRRRPGSRRDGSGSPGRAFAGPGRYHPASQIQGPYQREPPP